MGLFRDDGCRIYAVHVRDVCLSDDIRCVDETCYRHGPSSTATRVITISRSIRQNHFPGPTWDLDYGGSVLRQRLLPHRTRVAETCTGTVGSFDYTRVTQVDGRDDKLPCAFPCSRQMWC